MKSEYKFITPEKAEELRMKDGMELKDLVSTSLLKVEEINQAKKNDQDFLMAKGKLKTIEEGYKRHLDEHSELADYSLLILKERGMCT